MAYNFKEVMNKPERLAPGHRMCAGCGGTIAVRNVLRALHEGDKAVIGNATGCLEVSTFMYPYTAYEDSYIHNAFENAGATLSGVETAYHVLKKKGKLDETYKFITFGRILSWQFHFNPPICHSSKSDSIFQYYNTQRQNLHLRLIHGKFVQASNEKIDNR